MQKIILFAVASFIASFTLFAQDAETRLKEKGIVLTPQPSPVANYLNAVRVGNLLYLSGRGPLKT